MILLINYSHKWWYKALSFLLVVAIILAVSFGTAPRAHAVGVLTLTVCAGILAVMAGAGIYTVVSGMAAEDIQSWLQGKLQEWDIYRNDGNIFTDLIEENLFVMTVKGILRIGNSAVQGISNFITWLISDLGLSNNDIENVETSPASIGTFQGVLTDYILAPVSGRWVNWQFNRPVIVGKGGYGNYQCIIAISDLPFTYNNNPAPKHGNYYEIHTATEYPWNFEPSNPQLNYLNGSPWTTGEVDAYLDGAGSLSYNEGGSLSLGSDVIGIPDVTTDTNEDVYLGVDGVYPGATIEEWADVVMDGIVDNTLDSDMTITDEFVDAQEVVVVNEQAISVNTDHHMIGFTNLPDFVNLNLNSIWHYVSDAVEYASGFISWFVSLLSSVPTLAIPLYMSFTLIIVLSFIRRILL